MTRPLALACLLALGLAACQSGGSTPRPQTGDPTAGADGTIRPAGPAEPGVVKGRVTDEQGDPIAGAAVRVTGYTGGSNGHDDNLVTNAAGEYRAEVPNGMYEVLGTGPLTFDGGTYTMNLRPTDGDCDMEELGGGIVEDLVLPLTGLDICADGADPEEYGSYSGATVNLLPLVSVAPGARVAVTLEPIGPLADGSTGSPITFNRTGAALTTGFGPLESTSYLADIPLGRYRITGTADGQTLRFRVGHDGTPVEALEFGFEPVQMYPYGIRVRQLEVVDASWSG
jgi:hypothetical protein